MTLDFQLSCESARVSGRSPIDFQLPRDHRSELGLNLELSIYPPPEEDDDSVYLALELTRLQTSDTRERWWRAAQRRSLGRKGKTMYHAIVGRIVRAGFDRLSAGDYSAALAGAAPNVHHVFA